MALSDREQRLLDELERGFYESDPNLASKIGSGGVKSPARIIAGLAIGLIGISLIVFAVMVQIAIYGVIAFLVMLTGLVVASSNLSGARAPKRSGSASPRSPSKNIFESRWDRRRGE
ncbi:MAG: DUF3040 domain-containing protein [Rhodoluna sp.]